MRRLFALAASMVLVLAVAGPVVAIDSENGYKDCGAFIAALRSQWWGYLAHTPPGRGTTYHSYFGADWGVYASNGVYAGYWVSSADILHFGGTYPFCRNYG